MDDLPKDKRGRINWKESVGYKVKFIYDYVKGELEIINYETKNHTLTVSYNSMIFEIHTNQLISCGLSRIAGIRSDKFRFEIGQTFKDDKRDLVILDRMYIEKEASPDNKGRIYIENRKYYKLKCNKCGWSDKWIIESSLRNQNYTCSCCCGNEVVLGINTIWDTDRWMVDLGVSEGDAKKYRKSSNKKINVTCPHCKRIKKCSINKIYYRKSIGCVCRDGVSYPEKFIYSVLNQLNIRFQSQLTKTTFEWCGN